MTHPPTSVLRSESLRQRVHALQTHAPPTTYCSDPPTLWLHSSKPTSIKYRRSSSTPANFFVASCALRLLSLTHSYSTSSCRSYPTTSTCNHISITQYSCEKQCNRFLLFISFHPILSPVNKMRFSISFNEESNGWGICRRFSTSSGLFPTYQPIPFLQQTTH